MIRFIRVHVRIKSRLVPKKPVPYADFEQAILVYKYLSNSISLIKKEFQSTVDKIYQPLVEIYQPLISFINTVDSVDSDTLLKSANMLLCLVCKMHCVYTYGGVLFEHDFQKFG